jgi:hypothetical protein
MYPTEGRTGSYARYKAELFRVHASWFVCMLLKEDGFVCMVETAGLVSIRQDWLVRMLKKAELVSMHV